MFTMTVSRDFEFCQRAFFPWAAQGIEAEIPQKNAEGVF
jgi:hypothetical protein